MTRTEDDQRAANAASSLRGRQRVRYAAGEYAKHHGDTMAEITTPAARECRHVYARLIVIADSAELTDDEKRDRAREVLRAAGANAPQVIAWLRTDVP